MQLDDFTRSIRELVLKGKTQEALEELTELYDNIKGKYHEEVVVLASRMNRFKEENIAGILDNSQADQQLNKINHAILELLSDLPNDQPVVSYFDGTTADTINENNNFEPVAEKKGNYLWLVGVGSLVIAILLLVIFFLLKKDDGTTANQDQFLDDDLVIAPSNSKANSTKQEKAVKIDGEEVEPNDDLFTTNTIQLGSHTKAKNLSNEDVDNFSFTTSSGYRNVVKVKITNQSTSFRPRIILFNKNRDKLGEKTAANAGSDLSYSFQAAPNTLYHLAVSPYYGSDGDYVLSVGLERFEQVESIEVEENGSFEQANVIELNQPIRAFMTNSIGDKDVYQLQVEQAAKLLIDIEALSTSIRSAIEVFDADKKRLIRTTAPNAGANLSIFINAKPGIYFFQISEYFGKGGDYEFLVHLEE